MTFCAFATRAASGACSPPSLPVAAGTPCSRVVRVSTNGRQHLKEMRKLLIAVSCLIVGCTASVHESRLYDDLLRNYDNKVRPVRNVSEPVKVRLKVSLQQLIDLDEQNEQLIVNAWLQYVSADCRKTSRTCSHSPRSGTM